MLTNTIAKAAIKGPTSSLVARSNLVIYNQTGDTVRRSLYQRARNGQQDATKLASSPRPAPISTHSKTALEVEKSASTYEQSFMESIENQMLHMSRSASISAKDSAAQQQFHQKPQYQQHSYQNQVQHNHDIKNDTSGHTRLNQAVQYYANQSAIEAAARKPVCRLAPDAILYGGNNPMKMAQYLHKELPIRIAHRIVDFRCLPFIVGCDSKISYVHDLYIRAFHILSSFRQITDTETQQAYSRMLRQLLDDHKDIVSLLAEGFRACRRYIENEDTIQNFIDRTLASRLGIRLLAEHYLAIDVERNNHVGIINKCMSPKSLIDKWCLFAQRLCETNYGRSPSFRVQGHTNATFPYFEIPLNYIIPELLKNAARATVEVYPNSERLPDVTITIAHNKRDFIIKVSDFGGGIAHEYVDKVFRYHFSTSDQRKHDHPDLSSCHRSKSNKNHDHNSYCNQKQPQQQQQQHDSTQTSMPSILIDGMFTTQNATTANHHNSSNINSGSMSHGISPRCFDSIMKDPIAGDMHGFGFGLPISRAYAQYLGGNLQINSMQGIGTDVYLRLMHLTSKHDNFVI